MYFVGIDWADQKHDIVILNESNSCISVPFTIEKNPNGFDMLLARLRKLSHNPQDFKIGIETAHNLLVDFLVNLDYPVFTIFPGSMKSFRKRYRSSGARDDGFDAFVIADVLRTDQKCWHKIDFGSDLVRQIRICALDHHHLVNLRSSMINRLRATLKTYYPEYGYFFENMGCPTSIAFILACPDFNSARQLSEEQLFEFFKEHKLRDNKKISNIYQILHQQNLNVSEIITTSKKELTIAYAQILTSLNQNIDRYEKKLKSLLTQHPDSKIFLSYPGVGTVTATRLLSFLGDNRDLYSDASELQAYAGTCPVTAKSGKNYNVAYYRRACNDFFKDTMHNLAFASLTKSKWAMCYYKSHRQMGKKHNHALRCLANIHLKIIFAMWKNRVLYNEDIYLAQKTRLLFQKK